MLSNERIAEDLKRAMKERDEIRTSCLRMLKTSLKRKQVEKGRELTDEEIQGVLSSMVRKGKEAVEEFRKANREDLASREERETVILEEYLPKQLTSMEIEETVKEIISELSAGDPKDLGRVMKAAMTRMAGRAQGKEVNEIARKLLG